MNINVVTIVGAAALLMSSFAQPTSAAVTAPAVSNTQEGSIVNVRHKHGHRHHHHGHGFQGGWGWGLGGLGLGLSIGSYPRVYETVPTYSTRQCFYDEWGVRHCRRVYY